MTTWSIKVERMNFAQWNQSRNICHCDVKMLRPGPELAAWWPEERQELTAPRQSRKETSSCTNTQRSYVTYEHMRRNERCMAQWQWCLLVMLGGGAKRMFVDYLRSFSVSCFFPNPPAVWRVAVLKMYGGNFYMANSALLCFCAPIHLHSD